MAKPPRLIWPAFDRIVHRAVTGCVERPSPWGQRDGRAASEAFNWLIDSEVEVDGPWTSKGDLRLSNLKEKLAVFRQDMEKAPHTPLTRNRGNTETWAARLSNGFYGFFMSRVEASKIVNLLRKRVNTHKDRLQYICLHDIYIYIHIHIYIQLHIQEIYIYRKHL